MSDWNWLDVDGDGARDFFQPVLEAGVSLAYGPSGGGFGEMKPVTFAAGESPTAIAAGDLNLDGRLDLAVANRGPDAGSGTVTVFRGNRAGGFTLRGDTTSGARPECLAIGDFDGDGLPDVAVGKRAGANVLVHFGDGSGALMDAREFAFGGPVLAIRALDANEDGVDDLVAKSDQDTTPGSRRSVVLRLADGDRGFGPEVFLPGPLSAYGSLATGDLDLDGHVDVVAETLHHPYFVVEAFYGDGTGAFPRSATTGDGDVLAPIAIGDVDGDGLPDVVTTNGVVPGRGADGFGALEPFAEPLSRGVLGFDPGELVDVDSDGRLDLVAIGIPRAGINPPRSVAVLRGTGEIGFGALVEHSTSEAARSLAIGDVDGDCKPDVVVATSTGVAILLDRSLDAIAVRAGTVNAAAGPVVDVLFANGSAGAGAERRIVIGRFDPFELRVDAPPSLASAGTCFYAWLGEPHGGTVQLLPRGLGRIAMPTPVRPGCLPRPRQLWNNLGFEPLLGTPTLPSSPAPSVLVSAPGGLGGRVVAYVQGFIRDASAPNGRAAVTNGLVLDVR